MERELDEHHGLPLAWYEVLLYLHEAEDGHIRMHELAESLILSRSAATRFIDRMEDAGLVTREMCPTDRRGMFVVLTDEGRQRFRAAGRTHLAGIERLFSANVSDDEAGVIAAALGRVADRAVEAVPTGV